MARKEKNAEPDGEAEEPTVEEKLAKLQKQARLMMVVTGATLLLAAGGTAGAFALASQAGAHPADAAGEEEAGGGGGHGGGHGGAAGGGHGGGHGDAPGHGAKAEAGGHGGGHGEAAAGTGEPLPGVGVLHTFEPFVVNLLDAANVRYVKVRIAVETEDERVAAEVERRDAQLKDAVISVLSNRTYADLQGVYGKNQVREELLLRFNRQLTTGPLTRIYFTEFVVQ